MKKNLFYSIILCFLFSSCVVNYNVLVRKDSSAHIIYSYAILPDTLKESNSEITIESVDSTEMNQAIDSLKKFYDSDQITNLKIQFDEKQSMVSYDIKNIDSLGNFIDPFGLQDYPIVFKLDGSIFTVTGSPGNLDPNKDCDVTGALNMLKIKFIIEFESEIKKVKTKNDYIRREGKNKIVIETSIGDMEFSRIENKCVVILAK